MGLTDVASGAIDKAAGALGVGDAAGGPKPDAGTPEFLRKDPLDPPKPEEAKPVGLNGGDTKPNGIKPDEVIEFVHYGRVHNDVASHFAHPSFDNEPDKKPAGRGILFRDAVEREALLLHGFISATKTIHEELKKNRGPAGDVAGALGSLIGDSGKEPEPGSIKALLDDLTKAGGTINADACDYKKIHKAAIDLHQTRADYVKYCEEKLDGYYLKKQGGNDALLMALPSVAGAAKTVFSILFKAFDIYFAVYLRYRAAYEKAIEDSCYKFSIAVVKKYDVHTFAPWYPLPKKKKEDAKKSTLPSVLGDAENKFNEGKKKVTDVAGEVEKLPPAPGEPALGEIFAILGSGPSDKDKKDAAAGDAPAAEEKPASKEEAAADKPEIQPADALAVAAFEAVLDTSLPGFLAKAIGKMVWANVDFLKAVYIRLCKDSSKKIDDQWLYDTAHQHIFNKLYSFIEDNVSFIKSVEDANFNLMGEKLGPGKQIQKGKDALASKLGSYANPVIKLAVGKIGPIIEKIRSDADGNKALTMEVFLGNLPFLLALQVRNTTFPVWDLLITDLLGKGNAALSTALAPVKNFIGDAKNVAGDVKDYKDRATAFKDKWDKEGLDVGLGGQNVSEYKDILTTSTKKNPAGAGGGGGSFPGGARTTAGKADKIPADDIKGAEKDRKNPWPE